MSFGPTIFSIDRQKVESVTEVSSLLARRCVSDDLILDAPPPQKKEKNLNSLQNDMVAVSVARPSGRKLLPDNSSSTRRTLMKSSSMLPVSCLPSRMQHYIVYV